MDYQPRRTTNRDRRSARRFLTTTLVGFLGAWLAVVIWGGVSGSVGIVTVHAKIEPSLTGRTVLRFPPMGSITARTHHSPVLIDLGVDQVHIEQTAVWLSQHKSPQETADLVERGMRQVAYRLAWLALLVAALGALVACCVFRVGLRRVPWGIMAGVIGVAAPLALAVMSYDTTAFENPTFEGEMARAPHLMNIAQREWRRNSGIIRDIPRVAARTAALYQRLERTGYEHFSNSRQYITVLAISDLHNNPVAIRFARDLADLYQVRLVLISGDFTDLGHPLEAELLAGLKSFSVPIVAVSGNHDSRATLRVLRTVPQMTVLDGGSVVEMASLSILGYGDPVAARSDIGPVTDTRKQLSSLSRRMMGRLRRVNQPDIVMVHNDRVARDIAGRPKLIIEGHLHKAFVRYRAGSVVINPGTTGAAGLRYFSSETAPSCTAAVLHFLPGATPRLRKVDIVRLELPSGDFSVTRQSVTSRR